MERAFEHDGQACRIEARLEDEIWHVRAMRGDKVVCTAGRVPRTHRLDAEALGGDDPLRAMLDAYEQRIRSGQL
ncbi:hypothetical protein [Limimaricola pyoseonensis]|uniref:Uncharacterized protein n=1 Tax=Limimaricola pyoseonensis TaxID=521013 RepID=A0A1G7J2P0_9RHOB|nr:hypothetical protein [Limimaricola pyoseonensis]SDF19161.1 hypothetical protein SAMN04488567_3621 [Limimaricola pyoseonensis]